MSTNKYMSKSILCDYNALKNMHNRLVITNTEYLYTLYLLYKDECRMCHLN